MALADVTVLGDGANWIWSLAAAVSPQAASMFDGYHAIEHIDTAVKVIWDESADAASRRQAGASAVAGGKVGIERWLAGALGVLPARSSGEELPDLAACLPGKPPDTPGLRREVSEWSEHQQWVDRGCGEAVGDPSPKGAEVATPSSRGAGYERLLDATLECACRPNCRQTGSAAARPLGCCSAAD